MQTEAARLCELTAPLIVQNAVGYGLSLISTAFLGHLGDPAALSAAVLANSCFNVLGLSLMTGLSAGMETLCGQAYGARSYRVLGSVLQRALLICWLACVPVTLLWLHAAPVLTALGQPVEIVEGAATFLAALVPSLFMTATTECLKRYLLTQRVVLPGTVVSLVTVTLAPLYYWALMFWCGWGVLGAAWAFNLCQATLLVGLAGYTAARDRARTHHPESTWGGVSPATALQGWPIYLRYALPAAAMICVEWWVYEMVIFMAGWLPNAEVAVGVMGLCFQVSSFVYMVALGFGAAVNTRVANHLGGGDGVAARASFRVGLALVAVQQTAVAAAVLAGRRGVVSLFTNSEEVTALVLRALPVVVTSFVGDGLNCVLNGTLRGAGRQALGAVLNLCGYWLVGLPLAWLFGFRLALGTLGFWMGLASISSLQALVLSAVVFSFDWQLEVQRAQALLKQHGLGVLAGADEAGADDGVTEDAPLLPRADVTSSSRGRERGGGAGAPPTVAGAGDAVVRMWDGDQGSLRAPCVKAPQPAAPPADGRAGPEEG